jgi:hypothetical protein
MVQASYKGIEIEMELHELEHGGWRCDYTLIKHPQRTKTIHHGDQGFPTMELARASALHEARVAIDAVLIPEGILPARSGQSPD